MLLLSVRLVIVGLAYLGTRAQLYRSATRSVAAAQAQALAWAGLEDAKAKLHKIYSFPPAGALGQETYTYFEEVTDSDGQLVGS